MILETVASGCFSHYEPIHHCRSACLPRSTCLMAKMGKRTVTSRDTPPATHKLPLIPVVPTRGKPLRDKPLEPIPGPNCIPSHRRALTFMSIVTEWEADQQHAQAGWLQFISGPFPLSFPITVTALFQKPEGKHTRQEHNFQGADGSR